MDWYEYKGDPLRSDFRNFLYLVWDHLGLPSPTPAQYEIAYFLQWGYAGYYALPGGTIIKRYDDEWKTADITQAECLDVPRATYRADILKGFRGVGKSYISSALALWKLLRDPLDEKILVVSASGVKAREFVSQTKGILSTMPMLAHLRPLQNQRDMVDRFDVCGASISQSPSLKAAGITGQITGSRSTTIIADDIEIPENSMTEDARNKLLKSVNEFDAIVVPGNRSQVIFLGTPQTEESIYRRLIRERGFNCFCYPARYPKPAKRESYVIPREHGGQPHDILAPCLREIDRNPALALQPTDPIRFNDAELLNREAKGRSFFALQYMLDTSLTDAERYPLKQFDLMVMSVNPLKAPMIINWGHHSDKKNIRSDLSNYGFSGDYWLGPLFIDPEWRPYASKLLFVDPSGRGADETAWTILGELHGVFHVMKVGGISGDIALAMESIAVDAKNYNVDVIVVEPNFGGEIWINAFQPILARVGKARTKTEKDWSCSVREATWASSMKEARIIDTLEPVMNQHRLVVDETVARDGVLMYQLTHIAKLRHCLTHDDRLDSLAGALAEMVRAVRVDVKQAAQERIEEELMDELEDFIETVKITCARGFRSGRGRRNGRLNEDLRTYTN